MSIRFNADEIFEMAAEIERQGAVFYEKAARITKDSKVRKMFERFSDMEHGHRITFEKMRDQLTSDQRASTYDPAGEAAMYLRAVADANGLEGKKSDMVDFNGNESPAEILKSAIEAEKNSIVFYLGLEDVVDKSDWRKVANIISEEKAHLRSLCNALNEMKSS